MKNNQLEFNFKECPACNGTGCVGGSPPGSASPCDICAGFGTTTDTEDLYESRERMHKAYGKWEGYRVAMRGLIKAHESHLDMDLVKHIAKVFSQGFENPMSPQLEGFLEGLREIEQSIELIHSGVDPISMENYTCSREHAKSFWISFLKDQISSEDPY